MFYHVTFNLSSILYVRLPICLLGVMPRFLLLFLSLPEIRPISLPS